MVLINSQRYLGSRINDCQSYFVMCDWDLVEEINDCIFVRCMYHANCQPASWEKNSNYVFTSISSIYPNNDDTHESVHFLTAMWCTTKDGSSDECGTVRQRTVHLPPGTQLGGGSGWHHGTCNALCWRPLLCAVSHSANVERTDGCRPL